MPGTPTTKYAIPTFATGGTDPVNTGHTQINSALTTIDGAFAGYATGTFAGKPAAGKAGRLYLCTDTGQWLADTGSAWVDLNSAPAFVSSLPGSPFDGQEIYYSADPTNGVVWHLRYRSAASGSYKWECVGGSLLTAEVATNESTTSLSAADLATTGPSLVIPLAGDYEFSFNALLDDTQSGGGSQAVGGFVYLKIGASAEQTADMSYSAINIAGPTSTQTRSPVGRPPFRRTITSAGTTVKLTYSTVSGTINFLNRTLTARPIRVG